MGIIPNVISASSLSLQVMICFLLLITCLSLLQVHGYGSNSHDHQNSDILVSRVTYHFKAKTKNDVHVLFSKGNVESKGYEIVIGGWGNTESCIRYGKQQDKIVNGARTNCVKTDGFLSPTEFKKFWITLELSESKKKITISVGKGQDKEPFMKRDLQHTHQVNYIGFASWDGSPAVYLFNGVTHSMSNHYTYKFLMSPRICAPPGSDGGYYKKKRKRK